MLAITTFLGICLAISNQDLESLRTAVDIQKNAIKGFDATYYKLEIRPEKGKLTIADWEAVLSKLSSDIEASKKDVGHFLESRDILFWDSHLSVSCRGRKMRNEVEMPIPKAYWEKMNLPHQDRATKRLSIFDGDKLILSEAFNPQSSKRQISIYSRNFTALFDKQNALYCLNLPFRESDYSLQSKPANPGTFILAQKGGGQVINAEITSKGFMKSQSVTYSDKTDVVKQFYPQAVNEALVPKIIARYHAKDNDVLVAFLYLNRTFTLNEKEDKQLFLHPAKFNDTIVDCRYEKRPKPFLATEDCDDVRTLLP